MSFTSAKRHATVQMHPLLAYGRLHRPPISYDITYTPSYRAIVDRSTLTPIPSHTLAQPATEPPTMIQLVLKADKLPWPIVATASGSPASSGSSSRFSTFCMPCIIRSQLGSHTRSGKHWGIVVVRSAKSRGRMKGGAGSWVEAGTTV